MAPNERAAQPLAVANRNLTYATAFIFLGNAPGDIDALNVNERIVFGSAAVVEREFCYLIDSRKRFLHDAKKFPLRTVLNKRNMAPDYLSAMVDKAVTFFWHGVAVKFDDKGKLFRAVADSGSPYTGIVLKAGEIVPWTTAASKNAPPE